MYNIKDRDGGTHEEPANWFIKYGDYFYFFYFLTFCGAYQNPMYFYKYEVRNNED